MFEGGDFLPHLKNTFPQIPFGTVINILAAETKAGFMEVKPRFQLVAYGAKAVKLSNNTHAFLLSVRTGFDTGTIIVYVFNGLKKQRSTPGPKVRKSMSNDRPRISRLPTSLVPR
jgi:hypothetical protein